MKTKDERIQRIRKGIPPSKIGIYDRALRGKSKTTGIKAKCLDCCCWQQTEAALCESVECPLFPYNPFRIRGEAKKRSRQSETVKTHATAGGGAV